MKNELPLIYNYAPPAHKGQSGKKPIIFLVHGYGADENDLFALAGEFPDVFHVVAPRAPIALAFGGAAWYSLNFENNKKFTDIPEALAAREILADFIAKAVEKYDADPQNVWLLGFSQGAILSYGLMSAHPKLVQRYIPLSGYIEPNIIEPISDIDDFKGIKAIAMHGTADQVIPVEWARSVKDFLRERHVEFKYFEYPMGHGISPEGFREIRQWVGENINSL